MDRLEEFEFVIEGEREDMLHVSRCRGAFRMSILVHQKNLEWFVVEA